jgi:hypothetical protein|tara:strand:+ start:676 stop:858 length:183 start_codon:yes stop_codon:yes gene_type:complete
MSGVVLQGKRDSTPRTGKRRGRVKGTKGTKNHEKKQIHRTRPTGRRAGSRKGRATVLAQK